MEYARTHRKFRNGTGDSSIYFGWHDHHQDTILAAIETRIGVVTGIPPHGDEEPINIHHVPRYGSVAVEAEADPAGDARRLNIHHDKVQKEFSAATVLVYLNDVTAGGGTVWPCTARQPGGATVRQACKEAFEADVRWFDGEGTTIRGVPKRVFAKTEVGCEVGFKWSVGVCSWPSGPSYARIPPPRSPARSLSHTHAPLTLLPLTRARCTRSSKKCGRWPSTAARQRQRRPRHGRLRRSARAGGTRA